MELYWRLPVPIQEAALSAYGWHLDRLYYGPEFDAFYRLLEQTARWSAEELSAWQAERLREMLRVAVERVPYYREAYRGSGRCVGPRRRRPGAASRSSSPASAAEREGVSRRASRPRRLYATKTSGTTGTSLTIYWPKDALQRNKAVLERRVHEAGGVSRRIPRAMMGGRPIMPGRQTRPPFWRRNWYWRQLYLSSYHVSKATASAYAEAIRSSRVGWVTGYGSAIAALAENATEAGERPVPLQAAIVSGDTLQPGMRASIEQFFGCRCFDM